MLNLKAKKTDETKKFRYKGKTQTGPVYEISTQKLQYNIRNGRIATEAREFNQTGKDLKSLSVDARNKIISEWLWNKDRTKNEATKADIEEKSQMEAGVVTNDGIILDGNRRFMLISRLNAENSSPIPFHAAVVDETFGDSLADDLELKLLENNLQRDIDEKVGYSPIEKYIEIHDMY